MSEQLPRFSSAGIDSASLILARLPRTTRPPALGERLHSMKGSSREVAGSKALGQIELICRATRSHCWHGANISG